MSGRRGALPSRADAEYRRREIEHLAAYGISAEDIAPRLDMSVTRVRQIIAALREQRGAAW